jgi:hypothetical protein
LPLTPDLFTTDATVGPPIPTVAAIDFFDAPRKCSVEPLDTLNAVLRVRGGVGFGDPTCISPP